MRKAVSPRTGPDAASSSRRPSDFPVWVEGLEARRLLAATPFTMGHSGLHAAMSIESVRVLGTMSRPMSFATPASSSDDLSITSDTSDLSLTSDEQAIPQALIAPVAQTYSGALNGKIVFTSGGHGWQWNSTLGRYATDRGDNFEIVEDFGNQEQMSFYADYALRAGATVVPMRPVGHQPNEVVLDNDSAGVTFSGSWSNSSSSHRYDEDYGAVADPVAYRFSATSAATETAVATYQPSIPQEGFYPVYTWVLDSSNRTNQLYRVNHSGGMTEIRVDHRKVGKGWVYLGTYHFNAGSSPNGNVQISNQSTITGNVIADAIRFGNGMGDYTDSNAPGPSGYTREDENSYKWIRRGFGVGGPSPTTIVGTGNVSAPSNMAQWMNANSNPFGTSVYIGFHSNAGGGRGAVGLIDSDQGTPNQGSLALYTGRQINQDMQALNGQFEHNWSTRTTHTYTAGFGEIDLGSNAEMDATIIETAFHDSQQDSELMRDPKVRMQLAKSTLDATLEYFDLVGPTMQISAPSAPVSPRATVGAGGNITLNWNAGPTGAQGGSSTGYRVYVSRDGKGFGKLADVAGTSYTIPAADLDGGAYYFRVAATNAGGESPMSYVVGARKNGAGGGGGTNRILIVNGFDRFDRNGNVRGPYAFTSDRLTDRVRPLLNNSFDYVAKAGEAIEAYTAGGVALGFDSVQNEHVSAALLSQYRTVVWLAGEESTADETFSSAEQSAVSSFIGGGGALFVSGSEIGWDLDRPSGPTAGDRSFYNNTLKADYVADDANTYTASAAAGSIFAGMPSLSFNSQNTVYHVDFPDVLGTAGGSTAALHYSGGTGGIAATQWSNLPAPSGGPRVVNMAFPFETITSEARRNDVMGRVLSFFQTAVSATPGIPDLLATSDSGTNNNDNITNRDNSSPSKNLQFLVGGTVAGSTVTIYADGIAIGTATGTAGSTTVTTNGAQDLLDGARVITARQQETGKSVSAPSAALDITIETVPPVVTDVFIAGTNWTQPFRDFLQSSGQGDATYGYRLTNAQHADELPWVNLNQVSVRFSEDVNLGAGALRVFGVNVPQYAGSVTYDPATFTATFQLTAGVFAAEKLLMALDDAAVTDLNSNPLDGEWANPAETTPVTSGGADAYPSGNGTAGGDFSMRLNVLPGDVNRDGRIVGNDVTSVRGNQGFVPGGSGYTIFRDVTGDARIVGNDVTAVRSRQGITLPLGTPGVP